MKINKDTKIYASFAEVAGNNGCNTFNSAFNYYGIDAIYKSFSVSNIEDAVNSARALRFSGFAVTMPFKQEVLTYVDELDETARLCGSANTIVNRHDKLIAYNTDYLAAKEYAKKFEGEPIYILGNGGYSRAVQVAVGKFTLITRTNWELISKLSGCIIWNCTPVDVHPHKSVKYIDSNVHTPTGYYLSLLQANFQLQLYEDLTLPFFGAIDEQA